MTRRAFLTNASVLAAAAVTTPACSTTAASTATGDYDFPLGYQLYSIRDRMTADPRATLAALRDMGYTHGEVYGFDVDTGRVFGVTPTQLRAMLDELGMRATSGHYNFADRLDAAPDEMRRYVDACLGCARALGSDYLVWPLLREHQRTLDAYHRLVAQLNIIGEHLAGSGVGVAYHNHGYEFEDHGGTSGYDLIRAGTDAERVKLQLDMYWLAYDPERTPAQLIAADPGRYVMWHIKDMHKVSRDYTELGNGSIDYRTYLPDPAASGLQHFYLEQGGNYTVDSLTSARVSAAYFKEQLRGLV